MTTLGGVDLSDDLHLTEEENKPPIAYSVRETLGGTMVVQRDAASGNAKMRLVARNDGSSFMGCFKKSQLDSLHAIAEIGDPVTLVHLAGTYTVVILEFNVDQSDEREAPGPNKRYHGSVLIQEV